MPECMYMTIGWQIALIIGVGIGAYVLGVVDGLKSRPPVHKGTYEGCESKEDQEKEYPDNWV